jgi:iron complex outermembrane receptor protein
MRKGVLIILMILISAFGTLIYAQDNLVRGIILDATTFKPLGLVSVNAGKNLKSLSDTSGIFMMKLTNGKFRLNFSRVGYKTQEIQFSLLNEKKEFQILLEPFANQLDQMVVAASRNATQISREVSSLNIVQPYLISNTNANDLSDVLNRVPGVSVIDGQPAIRGGVGYSYNTGSRVAVLLDDMPIMGADL